MDPTLRQFEYAVAVADHRHFRHAAEACHVTQPALSTQIAQLEQTLGVRLFERSRAGVMLTAEGEELVARARRVLEEVRELRRAAEALGRPGAGPLRLGTIPTMAPYYLPHLLPALRAQRPGYELRLVEDQTRRLLTGLRAGVIDLALLALPVEGDDLQILRLFHEDFVLLVPADHPLAEREWVHPERLRGEELLLLEEGHCLRDQALEICRGAGAVEGVRVHAQSLATLEQTVAAGIAATLLPVSALADDRPDPVRTRCVRFADPAPGREVALAWRRRSANDAEWRTLGAILSATMGAAVEGVHP